MGYEGLHGVTGGYKGLQGVTGGYKGLPRGYKRLQGVTGGYKGLEKLFSNLNVPTYIFLVGFCIKIKVEEISNFGPK